MDKGQENDTEFLKGVEKLRLEVEKTFGQDIATPADFDRLSSELEKSQCGRISSSTLKRVWGYIHDAGPHYSPSNFTLRALSKYIGYDDFKRFLKGQAEESQSKTYIGNYIESRKLPLGTYIRLTWAPDRQCTLHHIKESLFEVTDVVHAKIHKGDMVECGCFTQNAPAYFSRVFRDGSSPITYVAGSRSGIHFQIVPSQEI